MPNNTFNIGYDPLLITPNRQGVDYTQEIDSQMKYLQAMKDQLANSQIKQPTSNNSLWTTIDNEINNLNDEQKNVLFGAETYVQTDIQLKQLIQEALIDSVKGRIEQSEVGKNLLTKQLEFIKNNKAAIIAESNKKLEIFEKFQIAAKANPNLTYKEFCESIQK